MLENKIDKKKINFDFYLTDLILSWSHNAFLMYDQHNSLQTNVLLGTIMWLIDTSHNVNYTGLNINIY